MMTQKCVISVREAERVLELPRLQPVVDQSVPAVARGVGQSPGICAMGRVEIPLGRIDASQRRLTMRGQANDRVIAAHVRCRDRA